MKKIHRFISQHAHYVVFVSWLVFTLFLLIILPWVSQQSITMGLTTSIDTNFSFNPHGIYAIVASYGPEGRAYYILQRWTFDVMWPFVYALPLWISIRQLVADSRWRWLSLIPLLAMGFDYMENIVFTMVVGLYPFEWMGLALIGVGISLCKWLSLMVAYVLLFLLGMIRLVNRLRQHKLLKAKP